VTCEPPGQPGALNYEELEAERDRLALDLLRAENRLELMGGICGVVLPHATPDGTPVACAFAPGHVGAHSWASLPTIGVTFDMRQPEDRAKLREGLQDGVSAVAARMRETPVTGSGRLTDTTDLTGPRGGIGALWAEWKKRGDEIERLRARLAAVLRTEAETKAASVEVAAKVIFLEMHPMANPADWDRWPVVGRQRYLEIAARVLAASLLAQPELVKGMQNKTQNSAHVPAHPDPGCARWRGGSCTCGPALAQPEKESDE